MKKLYFLFLAIIFSTQVHSACDISITGPRTICAGTIGTYMISLEKPYFCGVEVTVNVGGGTILNLPGNTFSAGSTIDFFFNLIVDWNTTGCHTLSVEMTQPASWCNSCSDSASFDVFVGSTAPNFDLFLSGSSQPVQECQDITICVQGDPEVCGLAVVWEVNNQIIRGFKNGDGQYCVNYNLNECPSSGSFEVKASLMSVCFGSVTRSITLNCTNNASAPALNYNPNVCLDEYWCFYMPGELVSTEVLTENANIYNSGNYICFYGREEGLVLLRVTYRYCNQVFTSYIFVNVQRCQDRPRVKEENTDLSKRKRKKNEKEMLTVYPNPVQDVLNINFNDNQYQVQIFNAVGQKVFIQKNLKGESTINLSHLKPGIYILKADNGEIQDVKQIIKQ